MRAASLAVLVLVLVLALGCKKSPAPTREGPAARVVSISPSTTEAMFALGADGQIVGRSRYCDHPEGALSLPPVGGYVDPSFEAILALSPDLVVGERGPVGPKIAVRLEERGVSTFFPKTDTFADIDAMLLGLGQRTGREREAGALVGRIHARLEEIEHQTAALPRPRVLLVFGLSPLSVAGPASFAHEMIRRAGGANVVEGGGAYPTLGIERVMSLDPDVIVNASMGESQGHERITTETPGWSKVRAVVEGKVTRLTDESVLRPGPRIAEGLATLARAIHPEAVIR
jgi:iron complex transport system substrate-binding protein